VYDRGCQVKYSGVCPSMNYGAQWFFMKHRWLARIQRPQEARLPTSAQEYRSQRGSGPCGHASRLSGRLSPETLVVGDNMRKRFVMSISSTTSMSLRSGLIAVSHGCGACNSMGSCSRLCLWSRYRTRSSSTAGILMKINGRGTRAKWIPPNGDSGRVLTTLRERARP